MNVKLLRKVQKHILAVPERLDMDLICDKVNPEDNGAPPCGAVGCIAGWAHMLTMDKFPVTENEFEQADNDAWKEGQKKLELDLREAERLFTEPKFYGLSTLDEEDVNYQETWPANFAKRYLNAKTAKGRAKVTSDRIDHFIKTKGRE